jgi:hypothetical protein
MSRTALQGGVTGGRNARPPKESASKRISRSCRACFPGSKRGCPSQQPSVDGCKRQRKKRRGNAGRLSRPWRDGRGILGRGSRRRAWWAGRNAKRGEPRKKSGAAEPPSPPAGSPGRSASLTARMDRRLSVRDPCRLARQVKEFWGLSARGQASCRPPSPAGRADRGRRGGPWPCC